MNLEHWSALTQTTPSSLHVDWPFGFNLVINLGPIQCPQDTRTLSRAHPWTLGELWVMTVWEYPTPSEGKGFSLLSSFTQMAGQSSPNHPKREHVNTFHPISPRAIKRAPKGLTCQRFIPGKLWPPWRKQGKQKHWSSVTSACTKLPSS